MRRALRADAPRAALDAYVQSHVREEIRLEALVRELTTDDGIEIWPFERFTAAVADRSLWP
ncbi:MAG TPA: hypothetical protein VNK92_03550 [Vicinamibacterales bacterium]|nr:hypothetical protein [Vicinamibacterales bacterium]